MTQIINLLDHEVVVGDHTIPPSGTTVRISYDRGETFYVNGIRFQGAPTYHGLVQEPSPVYDLDAPDTIYIVSQAVAFGYPQRNFASPGSRVANKDNKVIGCRELRFV